MHTSIRKPQTRPAQTKARKSRIPKLGHRNTSQKGADYTPRSVYAQNRDHYPADDAHAPCGEDAEILHENGCFCAEDGGIVEGDREPECLVLRRLDEIFEDQYWGLAYLHLSLKDVWWDIFEMHPHATRSLDDIQAHED